MTHFPECQVTYDPMRSSLQKSTQQAFDEGFLAERSRIFPVCMTSPCSTKSFKKRR